MTRLWMTVGLGLVCLAAATPAPAQQRPPADQRNFLACPIVRDTSTVPCWVAEFEGELYFLGVQEDTSADWYPPQLMHQVLVEGRVADGPRVCGGIPLEPIRTSVMPELDTSCNTILPAEPGFELGDIEVHRGPGPSSERREDRPAPAPRQPPTPPFEAREFTVPFDFDSDTIDLRRTPLVAAALRYFEETSAAAVEVTTYRGATLLSTGETLVENPLTAERRARKIERVLLGLGVPADALTVTWREEPEAADGVDDHLSRRIVIAVRP